MLEFEKVLETAVQSVILPVSERFSGVSICRAYHRRDLTFPSVSVRVTGISDERHISYAESTLGRHLQRKDEQILIVCPSGLFC